MKTQITTQPKFIAVLIALGLAACGAHRTDVYLWPPADDVNDP